MKVILRFVFMSAVALALLGAVSTDASAFCSSPRSLDGCAGYPDGGSWLDPGSGAIKGAFWAWGAGDPASGGTGLGPGRDNGTYDISNWMTFFPGYGACPNGSGWASDPGIDNCVEDGPVPSPKKSVIAVTDTDGVTGYYGVGCTEADPNINFDFIHLGNIQMVPIPKAFVTGSSSVVGVSVTVSVRNAAADANAAAVKGDGTCTGLVRGYKLYQQVRPSPSGPPPSRDRTSGWLPVGAGSEFTAAADSGPQTVPCAPGTTVWVARSLVFESGFETGYLSADTRVSCDSTLSIEHPGDGHKVVKPRTPTRH